MPTPELSVCFCAKNQQSFYSALFSLALFYRCPSRTRSGVSPLLERSAFLSFLTLHVSPHFSCALFAFSPFFLLSLPVVVFTPNFSRPHFILFSLQSEWAVVHALVAGVAPHRKKSRSSLTTQVSTVGLDLCRSVLFPAILKTFMTLAMCASPIMPQSAFLALLLIKNMGLGRTIRPLQAWASLRIRIKPMRLRTNRHIPLIRRQQRSRMPICRQMRAREISPMLLSHQRCGSRLILRCGGFWSQPLSPSAWQPPARRIFTRTRRRRTRLASQPLAAAGWRFLPPPVIRWACLSRCRTMRQGG